MSKTMSGVLVIADISGYTMFLSESELEHAQAILQALLEILIKNTKLPLIISRMEGDAVISYASQDSILQGQSMLEMVEGCYMAFKRAIDLMVINTTCNCNACKNIQKLDLKFFIHFGTFGLQPLPAYTELIGNDVNLIHRLTKNHVLEKTGLKAYTLLTRPAVEVFNLQAAAQEMISLTESYEHIGAVDVFVQDMATVWERERDRSRLTVAPEEAFLILDFEFPVIPVHLWDYVTKPEYFAIMTGADWAETKNWRAGRVGAGSVYQCAHGDSLHQMTIVDWQPFNTLTLLDNVFDRVPILSTYRIEPASQGSRLMLFYGRAQGGNPILRFLVETLIKGFFSRMKRGWAQVLRKRMQQDLADGIRPSSDGLEIDLDAIRNSIRAELAKGE
jgi:Protein of unknown function (DUF2652)